MRIAIVGTGISGLVAAHLLHREHEIVVYEAGDGSAGTRTRSGRRPTGGAHGIDTGFIVFNDRNYPNFEALLASSASPRQPSHMGFSVSDGAAASSTPAPRAASSPAAPTCSAPASSGCCATGAASTARRGR